MVSLLKYLQWRREWTRDSPLGDQVEIPKSQDNGASLGEGDFNFFETNNKEYVEGRKNLERGGVILYFLFHMPDEVAFSKWCL